MTRSALCEEIERLTNEGRLTEAEDKFLMAIVENPAKVASDASLADIAFLMNPKRSFKIFHIGLTVLLEKSSKELIKNDKFFELLEELCSSDHVVEALNAFAALLEKHRDEIRDKDYVGKLFKIFDEKTNTHDADTIVHQYIRSLSDWLNANTPDLTIPLPPPLKRSLSRIVNS